MKLEYVMPTKEYCNYIADNLKHETYREVIGLCGRSNIRQEVEDCVTLSEWSRVLLLDDVPLMVFGIQMVEPINRVGCVWMLSTELTQEHKVFVGRVTKKYLRKFMEHYSMLFNYVDANNNFILRWLRYLGATIYEPQPCGIFGIPYRRFEFTKQGLFKRYKKSERWCN